MNLKYKIALLSFMCGGRLLLAQSQYSVEQVENSSNPQMIANFVKYNPSHPKTPILKEKLYQIITNSEVKPAGNDKSKQVAYPTASPQPKSSYTPIVKTLDEVNASNSDKNATHRQKTVNLLNHLFDNDPNKKEAYVAVKNNSSCDIVVYFSGTKNYTLDVKRNTENFALVDKGNYSITSNVCNAKYSVTKSIHKDMEMTLNYSNVVVKAK